MIQFPSVANVFEHPPLNMQPGEWLSSCFPPALALRGALQRVCYIIINNYE
jgi:hypothetical protein